MEKINTIIVEFCREKRHEMGITHEAEKGGAEKSGERGAFAALDTNMAGFALAVIVRALDFGVRITL